MIGFTITPSHIDYSKIIDADFIDQLVMGECIIIEGFAKELCPVDQGQLKNSIMTATAFKDHGFNTGGGGGRTHSLATTKTVIGKNGKARKVHDKLTTAKEGNSQAPSSAQLNPPDSENEGYAGSGLEYAGAVEYGRSDMPNYPRQPYLRPALDYSKNQREARRKKIIKTKIEQAYNPNPTGTK